jgi:hypothetical protein
MESDLSNVGRNVNETEHENDSTPEATSSAIARERRIGRPDCNAHAASGSGAYGDSISGIGAHGRTGRLMHQTTSAIPDTRKRGNRRAARAATPSERGADCRRTGEV